MNLATHQDYDIAYLVGINILTIITWNKINAQGLYSERKGNSYMSAKSGLGVLVRTGTRCHRTARPRTFVSIRPLNLKTILQSFCNGTLVAKTLAKEKKKSDQSLFELLAKKETWSSAAHFNLSQKSYFPSFQ